MKYRVVPLNGVFYVVDMDDTIVSACDKEHNAAWIVRLLNKHT